MQNNAYVTFLRHLPQSLQDGLAVKTLGGTEIAIATILRVDHEFFALKGRLAGTQDAGRVFFIPYKQIDHLYYQKEVSEADFIAAFNTLEMPDPLAGQPAPIMEQTVPEAVVEEAAVQSLPESAPVNRPTPVPLKSAVLERFRSRSPSSSCNINLRPSEG